MSWAMSFSKRPCKNYFSTWRLAHPYFNDFRNSIIQYTKVDLNWFFDQWLETKKELDYKLSRVKSKKGTGRNQNQFENDYKTKTYRSYGNAIGFSYYR